MRPHFYALHDKMHLQLHSGCIRWVIRPVISAESHLARRSRPAHADLLPFAAAAAGSQRTTIKKRKSGGIERGLTCEPEMPHSGGTCFDLLPLWSPWKEWGGVGDMGVAIWYVFVSISTFVYVALLKALIGPIDLSCNCYHKGQKKKKKQQSQIVLCTTM